MPDPTHALTIYRDVEQKSGHLIAYRCPDCDARGQIKTPTRAAAMAVFDIVAGGHRSVEGVGMHEEASDA